MAGRDEPLTAPPVRFAAIALAALAAIAVGALGGLALEAWHAPAAALQAFDPYLCRIARFTLLQAVLSTLVSVLPAILVARALSRHPAFPGRGLVLRLFALPLALPALVAALGILALFGRAGFLADFAAFAGAGRWPGVYGLAGILLAHAFFNLPLATRLLLNALDTVPADQWRLAAQLGMGGWPAFRYVEWPVLRAALPGVAGLVFMLCVTSFTIVLTLGGGPAATTLEVAIYQALRFDFDPARALTLTLVQLAMTAVLVALLFRLGAGLVGDAAASVSARRHFRRGPATTAVDAATVLVAALFVAAPMAAVVAAGLRADLARLVMEAPVRRAILTSLVLAAIAATLALAASWALVAGRHALAARRGARSASLLERSLDGGAALILVVPPIVIGAGWFILLRRLVDPFAAAPVMVGIVNAAMAVPFAMRVLGPPHDAAAIRHDRLCAALGIAGLDRLRLVDWPVLKRAALTAFAFSMALSLGDLGVIALFGSDAVQTLPYLLLSRLGAYRTADAAGLALILAVLCFVLMAIAGGRAREMP